MAVATQPSLGSRTPVLVLRKEPSSSTRNRLILSRSRSVTMLRLTASVVLSPCRGIRLIAGVTHVKSAWPRSSMKSTGSTTADSTRKQHAFWFCFWPAATPLSNLVIRLAELGVSSEDPVFWSWLWNRAAHSPLPHMVEQQYSPQTFPDCARIHEIAAAAQDLSARLEASTFDVFSSDPLPSGVDVLMLSDLFVTEDLARAHATRVAEMLGRGSSSACMALVVDPGRSTRGCFLRTLEELEVRHDGFGNAQECEARALAGELAASRHREGAPVSYEI